MVRKFHALNHPYISLLPSHVKHYTFVLSLTFILFSICGFSQKKSVVIGEMISRPNAILILNPPNADQGFLLPQLSTANRLLISPTSPSEDGLIVFDITEKSFYYWADNQWVKGLGSSALNQVLAYNAVTQKLSISGGNEVDLVSLKEIPTQTGQAGKYITTDGTTLSWTTLSNLGDITGIITGPGLTGGVSSGDANLAVAIDNTTISFNGSNQLQLKDGAVTPAKITSGGNNKMLSTDATGNVIWQNQLVNTDTDDQNLVLGGNTLSIDNGSPADLNALQTGGEVSGSINNVIIDANAISTPKIQNDAITTSKIINGAITPLKIASGGITKVLTTDAIGTVVWADQVMVNGDDQNLNLLAGNNLTIDGGSPADLNALQAAGEISGALNSLTINADAITSPKILNNAITTSKIINGAVTPLKIASGGITKVLTTDGIGTVVWADQSMVNGDNQNLNLLAGNNLTIDGGSPADLNALQAGGELTGSLNALTIAPGVIDAGNMVAGDYTSVITGGGNYAINISGNATTATLTNNFSGTLAGDVTGTQSATSIAVDAVNTAKILNATILNEDVNASAAIEGSKITPNFGGQNIVTTGAIAVGGATTLSTLASAGTTMVVANSSGVLSTQPLPAGITTGNLSTTTTGLTILGGDDVLVGTNATINIQNATSLQPGLLSSTDYAIFAGKLNPTDALAAGDISGNFVAGLQINSNAVGTLEMAADAVTTAKILNGAVTNVKILDNAVTTSKILQSGVNGDVLTTIAGATVWAVPTFTGAANGDLAGNYPNPTIASTGVAGSNIIVAINNAATTGTIPTSRLATEVVLQSEILTGGDINGSFATGMQILPDAVGTIEISSNAITTAKILDDAVTTSKILQSGVNGDVLTTIAGATVWAVPTFTGAANGDLAGNYPNPTIANTSGSNIIGAINNGTTTGTIATTHLASEVVLETEAPGIAGDITGNFLGGLQIKPDAVTTTEIANGTIINEDLAPAIDVTKLAAGAEAQVLTTIGGVTVWAASTFTAAAGGDLTGTYPNPSINTGAITSLKILDGEVTGTDINDASIANADLAPNAVTTDKIVDGTIANADLAPGIAADKLTAGANTTVLTTVLGIPTWSTPSVAGDVTGPLGGTTVARLQGIDVSTTDPTDLQILRYDAATTEWKPVTVPGISVTTSYYAIDAADFTPINSEGEKYNIAIFEDNTEFVTIAKKDAARNIIAPIHLPNGVTMTDVTLFYTDNASGNITARVWRKPYTGGKFQIGSNIQSSESSTAIIPRNAGIISETIVNSSNTYRIEIYLEPGGDADNASEAKHRIYGVRITYTQ